MIMLSIQRMFCIIKTQIVYVCVMVFMGGCTAIPSKKPRSGIRVFFTLCTFGVGYNYRLRHIVLLSSKVETVILRGSCFERDW